jgi:hypothetical protein
MFSHARKDGLVVQELQGETLVYDVRRDRAHCLNRVASLVWHRSDGRTSVGDMARLLERELGTPVDEQVVSLALERLGKAHLLRERISAPTGPAAHSRREIIRKLSLAGGVALLLPVVDSIVAPTPASAATCPSSCVGKTNGTLCGGCTGTKCCQGGLCVTSSGCGGNN